ncbi:MAG: proline reductase cluster protein PrdD [Bacillota bacterium]
MIKKDRLVIKSFHVDNVEFGTENKIEDGELKISSSFIDRLKHQNEMIESIDIDILDTNNLNKQVNSIMDFVPISSKVLGEMGRGITHTLTGVYLMLTGADTNGKQICAFGSSDGDLEKHLALNKAGTPKKGDLIIHFDVILKELKDFNRENTSIPFEISDLFIQEFREILKNKNGNKATEKHTFYNKIKKDKKKVVILKQIAGQGAMYDNRLFCNEPSGFKGGKSIIELKNMPVYLTPNEYRDGAIRALT